MSSPIHVTNDLPRVRAYAKWRAATDALIRSQDPEDKKVLDGIRAELKENFRLLEQGMEIRTVTPNSVHLNGYMSELAMRYANEAFIGDALLPEVPVKKTKDSYPIFKKTDMLSYPDDLVGDEGSANEVDMDFEEGQYKCAGRMLRTKIEQKTLDNQDDVFDWFMTKAENLAEGMAFNREKRQMTLLTTSANYGGNTAPIAAGSRWDTLGGGNPIVAVHNARDAVWRGRGEVKVVGFCPLSVYRVLVNNPVIVDKSKYVKKGVASRQDLIDLFELDDLLVAKAWENTANIGQAASISRMVSSACFGIVGVAQRPKKENVSFGYTLLFKGERRTINTFKPDEGTRGTWWLQASADEVSKVFAPDAGYLLTTVIGS